MTWDVERENWLSAANNKRPINNHQQPNNQSTNQPNKQLRIQFPRIKAPDVADWASVKDPEVRLMESGGAVRERVPSAAVASGQLHRVAMATAEQLVTEGMENLHLTGQRYPGKVYNM